MTMYCKSALEAERSGKVHTLVLQMLTNLPKFDFKSGKINIQDLSNVLLTQDRIIV